MKHPIRSLEFKNNKLYLIDQRALPQKFEDFICENFRDVEFAIADMVVRGAPAIGVAAAYGVVLAALEFNELPIKQFLSQMQKACDIINRSRPTAVNLMWAIKRMKTLLIENSTPADILHYLKVSR